ALGRNGGQLLELDPGRKPKFPFAREMLDPNRAQPLRPLSHKETIQVIQRLHERLDEESLLGHSRYEAIVRFSSVESGDDDAELMRLVEERAGAAEHRQGGMHSQPERMFAHDGQREVGPEPGLTNRDAAPRQAVGCGLFSAASQQEEPIGAAYALVASREVRKYEGVALRGKTAVDG